MLNKFTQLWKTIDNNILKILCFVVYILRPSQAEIF